MTYPFFRVLDLRKFAKAIKAYTCKRVSQEELVSYLKQQDLTTLKVYAHDTGSEFVGPTQDYETSGIQTLLKKINEQYEFNDSSLGTYHSASVIDDNGQVRHVKYATILELLERPSLLAPTSVGLTTHDGFTAGKQYSLNWSAGRGNAITAAGCPFIELVLPMEHKVQDSNHKAVKAFHCQLTAIPLSRAVLDAGALGESPAPLPARNAIVVFKPEVPPVVKGDSEESSPVNATVSLLNQLLGTDVSSYPVMPRLVVACIPVVTSKGVAWLTIRSAKSSSSIKAYSLPKQIQLPGMSMAKTVVENLKVVMGKKVFSYLEFLGMAQMDNWTFKKEVLLEKGTISVNAYSSAIALTEHQVSMLTKLARDDSSVEFSFEALDPVSNTHSYQWKHVWERQLLS